MKIPIERIVIEAKRVNPDPLHYEHSSIEITIALQPTDKPKLVGKQVAGYANLDKYGFDSLMDAMISHLKLKLQDEGILPKQKSRLTCNKTNEGNV